jgi:hypothetical protein
MNHSFPWGRQPRYTRTVVLIARRQLAEKAKTLRKQVAGGAHLFMRAACTRRSAQ